ncbi:hypothetical protein SAMN05444405_102177 [Bacteroides luti]|uniref:Uncharacterized protein n=1 Tax=Bacteroides luti TaxID=1297750 RepID=A0A1M4UUW3_9BACE|nr:hypothetical protein [Bacteroides luti]SHE60478.1 hypothetical protein SAMN05444405_102177 [Bacteroides luti]
MNVNAIGVQNSVKATSFGRKECCSECGQEAAKTSTVTIPKAVYAALLAAAVGGPLMTSCSPSDEPDVPPIVIPVDTVKQAPQQKQVVSMLTKLGIIPVTLNTKSTPAVKGDLVEFSFNDDAKYSSTSVKYDAENSTATKTRYKGTQTIGDGSAINILYDVTSSGESLILEKSRLKSDGSIVRDKTYKLTANSDKTVDQKLVKDDGSEELYCTYKASSNSSITRILPGLGESKLTNVLAVLKD